MRYTTWKFPLLLATRLFCESVSLAFRQTGGADPLQLPATQPPAPSSDASLARSRRDFGSAMISGGISSLVMVAAVEPSSAFPLGFGEQKERRQKELCLVNVLRLQYWAMTVADVLETATEVDQRKEAYLEARLGAKTIVAKKKIKIGGGASLRVFVLLGLQIKDCLDDLKFYAKNKKQMSQLEEDLIESLASIVEFDGLETTQDPSPRSSLTLGQYNENKGIYVRRMLAERVIPLTTDVVNSFGPETKIQCEGYVEQYYPSELPPSRRKPPPEAKLEAEKDVSS